MKSLSATIQMRAIEQYFPVVLFIMLLEFMEKPKCNHSKVRSDEQHILPVAIYFVWQYFLKIMCVSENCTLA